MDLLDNITIDREINRMLSSTYYDGTLMYQLSQNQIDAIKPLYERIMKEKANQGKGFKAQLSLIDDIIEGFAVKETERRIFTDNSDNKHMAYYDQWIGEGEADRILDLLAEYDLSSDVLRGIQLKDHDPFISPINPDIEIRQTIRNDGDTSLEVEQFQIYYKGKLIYDFSQDDGVQIYHNEDKKVITTEIFEDITSEYTGKISVNGQIANTFIDKKGNTSVRYPKGTIIDGIKVGGRFVKGGKLYL